MTVFHRYCATILLSILVVILLIGVGVTAYEGDMQLASKLWTLTLVVGGFTCVCHVVERRCVWSTDPQSKFNRRIFTKE